MKILLNGQPKSGKTTMLVNLLDRVSDKRGLIAKESRHDGERIGFDLVDSDGNTAALARTDKRAPYSVGRYFVNGEALDNFVEPLFTFGTNELLYIDEIGQMQLYSSRFKDLVTRYLDADNDFLGTISSVYEDDFIDHTKSRQDILICEVTPDNRVQLEQGLAFALDHRNMAATLSPVAKQAIIEMGRNYLRDDDYVRFKKLFKNAVPYLSQDRVKHEGGGFLVEGNTGDHHVIVAAGGAVTCDCDLFNGRGQFEDKEGECSHIQAVTLLKLTEANND